MTRSAIITSALMVLFACTGFGQDRAGAPSHTPKPVAEPVETSKLAVKRVVLYKNGVGYFEHAGSVKDNQTVAVSFTSGQLDDVLKSLTVLDLDGGRITGVTYGSSEPPDRQMADLRLNTGEKATL